MCVSMVAMYANSNAQSRRLNFRRCHTMVDYISEEDNENEADDVDEESKLIHKVDSPLLSRDNNVVDVQHSLENATDLSPVEKVQRRTQSVKTPTKTPSQKRASFQRQRFNTISSDSTITNSSPNLSESVDSKCSLQRNALTTSHIISKMKDRIRQRVFNYSEWPGAAALVQEMYRQRALDAIKESLNNRMERTGAECIPMQELGAGQGEHLRPRNERVRHSLATSNIRSLETDEISAKYLKRRSVSEGQVEHNRRMGRGVVCSNEDLRSIFRDYKKRKSNHLMYKRTHSVDTSFPGRETMESQFSGDSESSTQSSMTQRTESDAEESEFVFDVCVSYNSDISIDPIEESYCLPDQTLPKGDNPDGNANVMPVTETASGMINDENRERSLDNGTIFDPEILGTAIETHLDFLIQRRSVDSDVSDSKDGEKDNEICENIPEDMSLESGDNPKSGNKDSTSFWTRLLCIFGGQEESN